MEITNKSKWADEDLQQLIGKIIQQTGADDSIKSITISTGKGANKKELDRQFTGFCYPKKGEITIHVPATTLKNKEWTTFNSEWFAKVLTHEIHHVLGIEHNEMTDWWELDCSYANGVEVRTKRMKGFHDMLGERFDARL